MPRLIRLILYISFFLSSSYNLKGQSIISAGNVNGTWTKSGSPYKILGEIAVAKGSTLTLEPGTVIEFQGLYGLKVDGILNAKGVKGDSVVLKAATGKTWAGIRYFKNTQADTIDFNYCRFENVAYGFRAGETFFGVNYGICCLYSSPLRIRNSAFYQLLPNEKMAGQIYVCKGKLWIDSIYIFSNAKTVESFRGMIGMDTAAGLYMANIRTHVNYRRGNISGVIGILASQFQQKALVKNIINDPNTAINIGVSSSKNIELTSLTLRDSAEIILGDANNVIIKNTTIFNSKFPAIRSYDNCNGSIVQECVFDDCGTLYQQASLDLNGNGPLFMNCQFKNSKQGISVSQKYGPGTPFFLNCNFQGSAERAVGIEGYPVFVNCNFVNNTDISKLGDGSSNIPYFGGVSIYRESYNSRPYFYNCLFWANRDSFGHGNSIVLADKVVKADLINCLIQGDSSSGIVGYNDLANPQKFYIPSDNLTYTQSNGNVPGFIDSAAGNYSLLNTCNQSAYAINKGMSGNLSTQYPFTILKSQYGIDIYNTTDLAGNPRVADDTIDIGCYESAGNKKDLKLLGNYRDTTLCYGASNSYAGRTYGAVQSYQWQRRSGSSMTQAGNNYSLQLNDQRTDNLEYRLLVSNNECLPLKDSSRWFRVDINNPARKGITKIPNKDTIQLKDTLQLTTTAAGYQSFLWSNTATTSTIKFPGNSLGPKGTHSITLEARKNNGCVETDTIYVVTMDNKQGLQKLDGSMSYTIYPQPAGNTLYIRSNNNTQNLECRIYNLQGQLLLQSYKGNNNLELNISDLSPSIYLLEVRDTNTGVCSVVRWVKE